MKMSIFFGLTIFLLSTFLSCGDKKEEEMMRDFYLSQKRDPNLVGWWFIEGDSGQDKRYQEFQSGGVLKDAYRKESDNKLYILKSDEYWYTKGDTLMIYDYNESWMYGSREFAVGYKISQSRDSLFLSDKFDNNFYYWGVRVEQPK